MKEFNNEELALLKDALATAASRHESQARARPRSARAHDDTARAMRQLRARVMWLLTGLSLDVRRSTMMAGGIPIIDAEHKWVATVLPNGTGHYLHADEALAQAQDSWS